METREVSGIVKDAAGQTVIGANILLVSKTDTLRTATNADGIFIFKNVKQATFVVTITSVGFTPLTTRYRNNDVAKRIVLDPVELKDDSHQLNPVTINGTPSITYKTDTVEYRASDYKVRENSTVDELLKKMEGMEVGSDGSLTHQGQQVTKARLNGKDFAGGNLAQAIQNLPADIIEKIQIVDDYGDQAGRTGIKDGDPTKVLNMTTKTDRSVGNTARITGSDGSNGRYDERLFAQRINGNEQLGFIGNLTNTVNGVASTGISGAGGGNGGGGGGSSSGGSGGTTTNGTASVNYRDQVSKTLQINSNYRYTSTVVNSINNSDGANYLIVDQVKHTTNFINNSNGNNNNKTHNASIEFEYTPDSSNFWRITPGISYTGTNSINNSQQTYTDYQNQVSNGTSNSNNTNLNYTLIALYQHIFKGDHRRNFSTQFNINNGIQHVNTAQNTDIKYYRDSTLTSLLLDSLVHRTVNRGNNTQDYRLSLTYVEPLTRVSQLEFHAQSEYKIYDNTAITDNISPTGAATKIDSLSNIYKYSFLQTRLSVNYRLTKTKFNISLGAMAIPTHLQGTDLSAPNVPPTNRNNFYLVPLFRFQYQWSRTHQLSINYTGTPTEPSFTQIQPLPDYSNPQNPTFGNPNLGPSFTHTITTRYNNYFPNSKFNISANIVTTLYQDQIINNNIYVTQLLPQTRIVGPTIVRDTARVITNQTYYLNYSGGKSALANYNISKQLDNRAYNLALNGTVTYGYNYGMSGNVLFHETSWDINNRFGPRINPNTSLEINPYVSYEVFRSYFTNSPQGSVNSNYEKAAFNLEGKFYLLKDRTLTFEYNLTKNYINGISANLTKNPFVANAYIEKELFKRKNGQLRISAFDIFDQNNFINRTVTSTGFTDTKSNALSRYVMVSFILNLQKWSGSPTRNGRQMQRRGDGSFIVN
ncbi:MAG TPA: outer membrane beta-barrel protein [Mucilaginibacter sp.]